MVHLGPGDLFGSAWLVSFVEAWNSSDMTNALAGLGSVSFTVTDRVHPDVAIGWSANGVASLLDSGATTRISLAAPYMVWMEFIDQTSSAPALVLGGRMRVAGDAGWLLRYASAFGALSRVASDVPVQK